MKDYILIQGTRKTIQEKAINKLNQKYLKLNQKYLKFLLALGKKWLQPFFILHALRARLTAFGIYNCVKGRTGWIIIIR